MGLSGGSSGWCRWRKSSNSNGILVNSSKNEIHSNSNGDVSSTVVFLMFSCVVLGMFGCMYGKYFISPNVRSGLDVLGCQEDNDGSWSVGDSPFALKPIEHMNVWNDDAAAWHVANPVVTCGLNSDAGFPSNFVANPFLYMKGDLLYMFYETKNPITKQGDIGVAQSNDDGATWQPLGITLDEDWDLSFPHVFDYGRNIYMTPDGTESGQLRLYRAVDFPLKWTLHKIILKRPLADPFIISHEGKFWLFGSDHKGIGTNQNGKLEIYHSNTPFGPWKPHKKNPIYNTNESTGARNGGRPFMYEKYLYRVGQDAYDHKIRVFKVDTLTTDEFKEVEVPLGVEQSIKGVNTWNGARNNHLDVQKLPYGKWIAVMDGDRVSSYH